jgi:hypothetical protein
MTSTTNMEKTARTARQTVEMQRDSYEALAKNFSALHRRNVEFAQTWMTGGVELMRAYQNLFSPFAYARQGRQGIKAAQQTTQQTQQALQATQEALQATQEELRVAEEATVKAEEATERATVKAEKAEQVTAKITANTQAATREAALRDEEENREAALRAAVHSSLKIKDYEELNVDEVSKKLDGLSATELNKVREYEQHNKNRETLVEQIDGKIKATA